MRERLKSDSSVTIDLLKKKSALALHRRRVQLEARIAPYAGVFRIAIAEFKKSRLARIGALVLACLLCTAVFADLLASDLPVACRVDGATYLFPSVTRPAALARFDNARIAGEREGRAWAVYPLVRFGPSQRAEVRAPSGPSLGHPLGTDTAGRDVFARVVHGARTSLTVGLLAVVAFSVIGVFLGALAGFFRGVIDSVVTRLVETLTAFPTVVFVLVVQAILPHPTMYTLLLAIGLTRWTEVARLVRAEVLLVSQQDYSIAARALGASPWRVLARHVMPNAVAPALVAACFGVAQVVLVEAALDFLRVGVPAEVASWGEILSEARTHPSAWWLLAFPGVAIFATVASLNLVGEALRDALDPRLRDALPPSGGGASLDNVDQRAPERLSQLPPTA